MILIGVHFYDIKSLDMTDFFFTEGERDNNYMANREAATVIGSSIQKISERAFWGSIGDEVKPKGHDGFLTRFENRGYLFEVFSTKGNDLLSFGIFRESTEDEVKEANKINDNILLNCPVSLPFPMECLNRCFCD